MMPKTIRRSVLSASCARAALLPLCGCATGNLLAWSDEKPSLYATPKDERVSSVVRPLGTVVALPVFVAWDVVTFPFQWAWGIHPYGITLHPEIAGDK